MTPDDLTRTFRTKITICDCAGCQTYDRGPCWVFSRVDRYGYGQYKFNGKNLVAHRFAYERLVGPIPEAHDLDHQCDRHRNCVYPAHLEPATKTINAIRANERKKAKRKEQQ